ncbi:hypothetical protein QCA50_000981 [Cerrena zonata]|uniref:Uncharacterized protein n=1 Tax=Cerrena zonata TaxID=2478898 RepID=A0AAW0GZU9_9APHY
MRPTPLPYQYNLDTAATAPSPQGIPQGRIVTPTNTFRNLNTWTLGATPGREGTATDQAAEDDELKEGEAVGDEGGLGDEGDVKSDVELDVGDGDLYDPKAVDVRVYARTFARMGGVFSAIADIVVKGVTWEKECSDWDKRHPEDEDEEQDDDDPNPRDLKVCDYDDKTCREIEGWNILCDIILMFHETMMDFAVRAFQVKCFGICIALQKEIHICRGNDTSGLKTKCLHYIDYNLEGLKPELSLKDQDSKACHGWSHPMLAAALLPLKYEPTEENIVLAGSHSVQVETHHHIFPHWLYASTQKYNVKDENEGLFLGHYLIHVLRHIYTGPRSVAEGPRSRKRSRKGNNALHMGITELTPRAVAYACCQAHFAISNQDTWDQTYYNFDLTEFYWNIVDLLSSG